MNDLISRQAAIDALEGEISVIGRANAEAVLGYANLICDRIKRLPSADVVEVVRCKDCTHQDPEDKKCDCGHDIIWQLPRRDDWYCADGKWKDG